MAICVHICVYIYIYIGLYRVSGLKQVEYNTGEPNGQKMGHETEAMFTWGSCGVCFLKIYRYHSEVSSDALYHN